MSTILEWLHIILQENLMQCLKIYRKIFIQSKSSAFSSQCLALGWHIDLQLYSTLVNISYSSSMMSYTDMDFMKLCSIMFSPLHGILSCAVMVLLMIVKVLRIPTVTQP